jgi:hypothetical protein
MTLAFGWKKSGRMGGRLGSWITRRRTEPIANSPWLRVLAEPTGSYQDIKNIWIAHGYLSSSSYMPSQISVFAQNWSRCHPATASRSQWFLPQRRMHLRVISALAKSRRSRAAVGRNYRGGSAGFCELLIAHSLVQVSLNITIPSSLISLLKQARPPGL